jgi:hypothetical protein
MSLIREQWRINELPGFQEFDKTVRGTAQILAEKFIIIGLCDPDEDETWLLKKAFSPQQQALFKSYLRDPWDKNTLLRGPDKQGRHERKLKILGRKFDNIPER